MSERIKKITLGGLFLALSILLPYMAHLSRTPEIGKIFLPMHLPVMLAAMLIGPAYGAVLGIAAPFLSFMLTGGIMPPIMPEGIALSAELCVCALIGGFLYYRKHQNIFISMTAMILTGKLVSGTMRWLLWLTLSGIFELKFGLRMFLTTAFVQGGTGIMIQIVLIPAVIAIYQSLAKRRSQPD